SSVIVSASPTRRRSNEAKHSLRIKSVRAGFGPSGGWRWELPCDGDGASAASIMGFEDRVEQSVGRPCHLCDGIGCCSARSSELLPGPRPTLEDENGKSLADLSLLAEPTRLAVVPWLLVFFIIGWLKHPIPTLDQAVTLHSPTVKSLRNE